MEGSRTTVGGISKLTKIEELRERLVECFNAEPSRQRLFYRGKQVSCLCYYCDCAFSEDMDIV